MAKKKKSTQTNVIKKNAWSVVSIWWGILVFGLLIPALFLATCLDINSYKKAVWAYVEDEKGKLEQFNKDLDQEIAKTEAEIRDLEDKIAKLEGVTYDFLDPLYNVITKLESYALAGLPETEVARLMSKAEQLNSSVSYPSNVEYAYVLTPADNELFTVNATASSYTSFDALPETFSATQQLYDFKSTYCSYVENSLLEVALLYAFPENVLVNADAVTNDLAKLIWLDTGYTSDTTYQSLNNMCISLETIIASIDNLIKDYQNTSNGVETGITSVNSALSNIKETIDDNSYADTVKDQVKDLDEAEGGIFNDVESTFNQDKVDALKALKAELEDIFAEYTERLKIERERELFWGVNVDVSSSVLSYNTEGRESSVVQTFIATYKNSANPILSVLAQKLENSLPAYAEAYYEYRKLSAEDPSSVEDIDRTKIASIMSAIENHTRAYKNEREITAYKTTVTNIKNDLKAIVNKDVLVKVLHGIDVGATMNQIEASCPSSMKSEVSSWFDKVRGIPGQPEKNEDYSIESVNAAISNGIFTVATYSSSQFITDKEALVTKMTASLITYKGSLATKESYLKELNTRYDLGALESLFNNLTNEKTRTKAYDGVNEKREYRIGPDDSDVYTFKKYAGAGGMFGLTTGLIKSLLNPTNSLNRLQLISIVCIAIAIGLLVLTYTIQIIRIIIAKKTAWIFHDGAVIYRKGRIFYTEEFTRDMEYFPGMSVSVRYTIKGKIFKYGDVILSNGAGEAGEIVMRGVKNPKKVHQMLSQMLVACCTRTANMMSPYKMYPQMYRHVLGGYPAYYYGTMQMNGMNNTPPNGGK